MATTPARFLIVDDDGALALLLGRILRVDGHQVHTAMTAAAAFDDIAAWHPDAILLDYRMPLINGLGFLYRLRAHEKGPPTAVAIITGDTAAAGTISEECAALGATVHVKPIGCAGLLALARQLIEDRPRRSSGSHAPL
jgi:two-component system, OmpR family, response regulator